MTVLKNRQEATSKGLTPVEASWLTEVSAKTINATIDRGELAQVSRARRLALTDVLYIALRKEVGAALSNEAKRELYQKVSRLRLLDRQRSSRRLSCSDDAEIPLAGGKLRVEIKPACMRLAKRLDALQDAMNEIIQDPAIRSGEPVIRGTRIPVYLIGDLFAQGADVKEIMEDYPALDAGKIRAALAYVETRPKRGRPTATRNRYRKSVRKDPRSYE